jgi:hypothetical protein
MEEIIGPLILIALYIAAVYFIFAYLGYDFIYFSALTVSLAVPYVYVKTLMEVFGQDDLNRSRRNWLFVPLIALLTLIHIDLLTVALFALIAIMGQLPIIIPMPHPWYVQDVLERIVLSSAINHEFLGVAASLFPRDQDIFARILTSAALKSILIAPLALFVRGFSSRVEDPRQPAFVSYFHRQAFDDLRTVIQSVVAELKRLIFLANDRIVKVTKLGNVFVWPFTAMTYAALAVPIALSAALAALLVTMHVIGLGLIWALAMAVSMLLWASERAVILVRAGYAKCPHAQCHAPVPLPLFMCPECGTAHDNLVPGRFGVFHRSCKCGRGHLPTLFWFGKGRLRSACPVCHKPMREELFAENAHVPIYGGPSTGKTMYMMAATYQLLEGDVAGVEASLIEEAVQRNYATRWKPDFESGRVREKTAGVFPNAFLLAVRRESGFPISLYLYDPAGEALLSEADLEAHRFMKYVDGLALLVDPLSLPSFARRYRARGGPDLGQTTSLAPPDETATRMVNLLERLGRLSRRRESRHRIAVVLTKLDIPGLVEELGIKPGADDIGEDWRRLGAANSRRIREWLHRNEPHLLQILETRFADIRYFAVSALGHIPGPNQSFAPYRVIEPLAWLLSKRATLANPSRGRIVRTAREVGAVAAVFVVFAVLPLSLLWWVVASLI